MKHYFSIIFLLLNILLLPTSNVWADEVCCCKMTCKYTTAFGGSIERSVDQCFDIGIGSGNVISCVKDAACGAILEFGWVYLGEWTGTGCQLEQQSSICPFKLLLGVNNSQLDILRTFRDEVLSSTPVGQEIIELYYQWSPAIVKAMEEDEEFSEGVKELMDEILLLLAEEVE